MREYLIILLLLPISGSLFSQSSETIDWIKNTAIEIDINNNSDFSDLSLLASILKDKRIVMLGENTHGTSEYFNVKYKLIKYLHEELSYKVLAWESNLLDCFAVNQRKSELTSEEMAKDCLHFVYETKQVLPIMDYLKGHDLILTGFDSQPTVYSDATAKYITTINCLSAKTRIEFQKLDSMVQTPTKKNKKSKIRGIYANRYNELLGQIERSECDKDIKEVLVVGIEDRIHFLLNWNNDRDQRMATNLMWLLTEKYPEEKFIIYAHNAHIDPRNSLNKYANFKTLAEFLPDSILNQSYVVGIFGYEGQARNNVKGYYDFKEHPSKSLENYLHQTGYEATFLDITNHEPTKENKWLFEEINTMYWGNIKNPKILIEHYNAVILVDKVSPSVKLK